MYLRPELMNWIENDLIVEKGRHPLFTPEEQVSTIMDEYTRGEILTRPESRKLDKPPACGEHVWELKTEDVRIFGYFYRPRQFIAVSGETKVKLLKFGYASYIRKVLQFRENCNLTPPTHQKQDEINDLL